MVQSRSSQSRPQEVGNKIRGLLSKGERFGASTSSSGLDDVQRVDPNRTMELRNLSAPASTGVSGKSISPPPSKEPIIDGEDDLSDADSLCEIENDRYVLHSKIVAAQDSFIRKWKSKDAESEDTPRARSRT